jgi:chromosome partitioning protein
MLGMIICFFSQKGGNGKSTFTVHLALELMFRGFRVTLVDTDPQGSTTIYDDIARSRNQLRPQVVGLGTADSDAMVNEIVKLSQHADFVLVDTKGGIGERAVSALEAADVAILPCLPAPFDFNSLPDTINAVQLVQQDRPELVARLLINCTYNTTLSRQYVQGIKNTGFPRFNTEIPHRAPFKESIDKGKGVTLYLPKSKAAVEVRSLADEIEALRKELPSVAV